MATRKRRHLFSGVVRHVLPPMSPEASAAINALLTPYARPPTYAEGPLVLDDRPLGVAEGDAAEGGEARIRIGD